jgi:uncharacterized protein YndB with AHSA1/START domain
MTETPTRGRALELEVTIDATLEVVWRAVSEGESLARWFSPEASLQPGAGGNVQFSWGPGEEWQSQITVWEPNARVRFESDMPGPDGNVRLAVDFLLEARGGKTVVRLVHSGFEGDGWDDFVDGTQAGWSYFLVNLRHYVERHAGTPRVLLHTRPRLSGSRAEADRAIFGAAGLDLDLAPDALQPGQRGHVRLGGQRDEVRVVAARRPRATGFLLPGLNDALLFVERESLADAFRLGVWLSTYGLAPDVARALQADLDALGERLRRALPEPDPGALPPAGV